MRGTTVTASARLAKLKLSQRLHRPVAARWTDRADAESHAGGKPNSIAKRYGTIPYRKRTFP